MDSILIIGAGVLQAPAFLAARRMGLRSVGIDRDAEAPGALLADAFYPVDTHDVTRATEVAQAEHVGGVMTLCTDMPVRTVAAVASRLALPGIGVEEAFSATNKSAMRDRLARAGVPVPRYVHVSDLENAASALRTVGLPAIVKPVDASGSRGITLVKRATELAPALKRALNASSTGVEALVEEFVDGPEVSVEAFSIDGAFHLVAVTDKRTSGPPYFIERVHVQPSRMDASMLASVAELASSSLAALGLRNSAAHVEIRLGTSGPRVIEVGARLGGDFITTELVPRSTGCDVVAAAVELALGRRPTLEASRHTGAAICYLTASPGRVRAIDGLAEAAATPGVVSLQLSTSVGEYVRPLGASQDRVGYVIAERENAEQAEAAAVAAAGSVRIRTE